MSTIRLEVTDLIIATLKGNTIADQSIFYGRDWPTDATILANGALLIYAQKERKERVPSGQLQYKTSFTIDVLARVARGGPETTLRLVNVLVEQVSAAVITDLAIHKITNYAPSVDIEIGMTSEGEMQIAQALISFGFEYTEIYRLNGTPIKSITNNSPGDFGAFMVNLPQTPS